MVSLMQEILKKKMRHTFLTFGNKDAEKGGTYKAYTCGSAIRQLAGSPPRQIQCSATMSFPEVVGERCRKQNVSYGFTKINL